MSLMPAVSSLFSSNGCSHTSVAGRSSPIGCMMLIYITSPRLVTSIAITVPACFYLLQPRSHDEHSHDGHGHEDEHAEKAHEEAPAEEEQGEHKDDEAEEQYSDTQGAAEPSDQSNEETAQSDESREQPSEESESSKESDNPPKEKSDISESQDISLLSRLKDGEVDEETKEDRVHASDLPVGKGPRRDSPPSDTREHIPDAKGAAKRRIDSEYGHRQGSEQSEASSASRTTEDEVSLRMPDS